MLTTRIVNVNIKSEEEYPNLNEFEKEMVDILKEMVRAGYSIRRENILMIIIDDYSGDYEKDLKAFSKSIHPFADTIVIAKLGVSILNFASSDGWSMDNYSMANSINNQSILIDDIIKPLAYSFESTGFIDMNFYFNNECSIPLILDTENTLARDVLMFLKKKVNDFNAGSVAKKDSKELSSDDIIKEAYHSMLRETLAKFKDPENEIFKDVSAFINTAANKVDSIDLKDASKIYLFSQECNSFLKEHDKFKAIVYLEPMRSTAEYEDIKATLLLAAKRLTDLYLDIESDYESTEKFRNIVQQTAMYDITEKKKCCSTYEPSSVESSGYFS